MKYFLTLLGVVCFVVIFLFFRGGEERKNIQIQREEYVVSVESEKKIGVEDFVSLFKRGVAGNKEVVEQIRDVPTFKEISSSNAINVLLKKGDENKVVVRTNSDLQEFVKTKVENDKLKIFIKGNIKTDAELTVWVTYTELKGVKTSSASKMICEDKIQADSFYIEASSASDINLANVEAENIKIEVSAAANVEISGNCDDLEVEISSASNADLFELIAKKAVVEASSASNARVYVINKIDAEASSMATVRCEGTPKYITKNTSSGGSIYVD